MSIFSDLADSLFGSPDQSHLSDITSNPVGYGNKRTTDLGGQLARMFQRRQQGGIDSALDVLAQKGDIGPRAENAARADIERDRQSLQQDISQAAGNSGTTGFAGTGAIQAQADAGAANAKNKNALAFAQERSDRARGDLGGIFGNLLVRPAMDLIANRSGAAENTKASGFQNFAQTAGRTFNMFSTVMGAGGKRRRGAGDQPNYGYSDSITGESFDA